MKGSDLSKRQAARAIRFLKAGARVFVAPLSAGKWTMELVWPNWKGRDKTLRKRGYKEIEK